MRVTSTGEDSSVSLRCMDEYIRGASFRGRWRDADTNINAPQNNTLISGDNNFKGMAAYLDESSVEPHAMPGNTTDVAGFVQGAVGDTSPIRASTLPRAFCEFPGRMILRNSNSAQARGRERDRGGMRAVKGRVQSAHAYVDMSRYEFVLANGTAALRTSPAAMGVSFAGGTKNPFWELVKVFITPAPSSEQVACQFLKPILLNTGHAHEPYGWTPSTVHVQTFSVGNFGELTTMAGRHIRTMEFKQVHTRALGRPSGGRIGFRFSIVELKALLFTLLRAFEIHPGVPKGGIGRSGAVPQGPIVLAEDEDERRKGSRLPLVFKFYKE
ncbi:Neutral/alkaline non-lysosomal ceramidase-domain-containing protein [Mycena capillaripes]|nr:Neutral/alkaline non-lysosomal ceramidase-domain-containing protein [Mycena capillaripes]